MYLLTWQKPIKIGQRDIYTIDLASWAEEEDILTVVPSLAAGLVTLHSGIVAPNKRGVNTIVGVNVSGLAAGLEEVTLEYSTATRSDLVKINLLVGETCQIH